MLLVCLLSVLLAAGPSQASPAQPRLRREAIPLFDSLVSDLARPFLNLFRPKRPQSAPRPAASYGRPAVSSYSPPAAPSYSPPAAPSYSPPAAPSYQPQAAPVYAPQTYVPAVVEPSDVPVSDTVALKSQEEETSVDVQESPAEEAPEEESPEEAPEEESPEEAPEEESPEETSEEESPEEVERQPKLLVEDPSPLNTVEEEEETIVDLRTSPEEEKEIIIDLTEDVELNEVVSAPEEEVEEDVEEEVLITGDQTDKKPQVISLAPSQIPNIFAPIQKSNEIISFVPVEDSEPVQSVPVVEVVTPLLQDEDLRSLLASDEEGGESFALIDEDYIDENNLIPDLAIGDITEDITATENILEIIVTEAPNKPAETAQEQELVPPTISADPVFKEIVSDENEQVKRGFRNYDPRNGRVYAHKYSDNYSNWYYFRRGY